MRQSQVFRKAGRAIRRFTPFTLTFVVGCGAVGNGGGDCAGNDCCDQPDDLGQVSDGADITRDIDNFGARGDESVGGGDCGPIGADLWYSVEAQCKENGIGALVRVDLCQGQDSNFDTVLEVFKGNETCPQQGLVACSDDGCQSGNGLASDLSFPVQPDETFLIRVGGFDGDLGTATLNVSCGSTCSLSSGACCFADGSVGCSFQECCEKVCSLDSFCCTTEWDDQCAQTSAQVCPDLSCGDPSAEECFAAHDSPGCDDLSCCQAVCEHDSCCCSDEWTADSCVVLAQGLCEGGDGFDACRSTSGDCFSKNDSAGCNDSICCQRVCQDNPFCCLFGVWDDSCVAEAEDLCPCDTNADCDDGLFCNGVETCEETDVDGRNLCVPASSPCEPNEFCGEAGNSCVLTLFDFETPDALNHVVAVGGDKSITELPAQPDLPSSVLQFDWKLSATSGDPFVVLTFDGINVGPGVTLFGDILVADTQTVRYELKTPAPSPKVICEPVSAKLGQFNVLSIKLGFCKEALLGEIAIVIERDEHIGTLEASKFWIDNVRLIRFP